MSHVSGPFDDDIFSIFFLEVSMLRVVCVMSYFFRMQFESNMRFSPFKG